MSEQELPTTLDNLPKLVFWEVDVATFFLLPTGLGLFTGFGWTGLISGGASAYFYAKFKSGKARGFARHLIYWVFPVRLGFKRTPPSYIREFVG